MGVECGFWRGLRIAAALGILGCAAGAGGQATPFDLVIRHGHIVDGTGSPWYSGDVGIRDGRIAAIGNLADAAANQSIDAEGRVVAPGFIDMLGQSELTILVDPRLPSKIYQGHHDGDYGRREFGGSVERCDAGGGSSGLRALSPDAGLAHVAGVFCAA
jgi:hypothetical protein